MIDCNGNIVPTEPANLDHLSLTFEHDKLGSSLDQFIEKNIALDVMIKGLAVTDLGSQSWHDFEGEYANTEIDDDRYKFYRCSSFGQKAPCNYRPIAFHDWAVSSFNEKYVCRVLINESPDFEGDLVNFLLIYNGVAILNLLFTESCFRDICLDSKFITHPNQNYYSGSLRAFLYSLQSNEQVITYEAGSLHITAAIFEDADHNKHAYSSGFRSKYQPTIISTYSDTAWYEEFIALRQPLAHSYFRNLETKLDRYGLLSNFITVFYIEFGSQKVVQKEIYDEFGDIDFEKISQSVIPFELERDKNAKDLLKFVKTDEFEIVGYADIAFDIHETEPNKIKNTFFSMHYLGETDKYLITEREKELLYLGGSGLSNKDIADRMSISQATVEEHFSRIDEKFTHYIDVRYENARSTSRNHRTEPRLKPPEGVKLDKIKRDSIHIPHTDDQLDIVTDPIGSTKADIETSFLELKDGDAKRDFVKGIIYTENPKLVEQIEHHALEQWASYERAGLSEKETQSLIQLFCIAKERHLRVNELPKQLPDPEDIILYRERNLHKALSNMNAEEFYMDRWHLYHVAGLIRTLSELRAIDEPLVEGVRQSCKNWKQILPIAKGDYSQLRSTLINPFFLDANKPRR